MTAGTERPRLFLGWAVVAVGALAGFAEVAFYNPVLGVFIPEFEREFGWSRTEISAAVTLGSLVGAALAVSVGPLIDRHGGRPFVAGGGLFLVIGLVLLSLMEAEWQFFIIYAIGRGAASGIISLAVSVTVSKWFIRRRGLAVGVTTLGTRAGFALLPIGTQLIIEADGWRTAALALAGLVAVCGILPAVWWLHPRPERLGLEPDGGAAFDSSTGLEAGKLRTSGAAPAVPEEPPPEVDWTRQEALRTRAFWLVTAAVGLLSWAGGAINLHQIPHLVDRGLSPQAAALTISLVAVFAGGGALLEGVLDARIGARWTLVIGLCGSALGMVVLMNTASVAMGAAFAVSYGTSFGLMVTSSQVVFADYFGREALGAIRGSAAPIQLGLNAVGPLVAGAAYDLTGSYLAAFIPFTCGYLVAAFALAVAKKPALPQPRAMLPLAEVP